MSIMPPNDAYGWLLGVTAVVRSLTEFVKAWRSKGHAN